MSKRRRILKWAGLAVSLLILTLWVASTFWAGSWTGSRLIVIGGRGTCSWIDFHDEASRKEWSDMISRTRAQLEFEGWAFWPSRTWDGGSIDSAGDLAGHIGLRLPRRWSGVGGTHLWFPLWIPFLLVALTPDFLFWRDRRRPQPGHCLTCGYNLAGNVSGVCPECGAAVPENTSSAMRTAVRRQRYSVAASMAVAANVFLMFPAFALLFLHRIYIAVVTSGFQFGALSMNAVFEITIALGGVGAYLLSRTIFQALRWQTTEYDGCFCLSCDYDLAGNVSVVCPECGEPCKPEEHSA